MEGPVPLAGGKASSRGATSRKQSRKPPRRRLLRRLCSNAGKEASDAPQPAACVPESSQKQKQPHPRPRSFTSYLSLSHDVHGSPPVRRFTPPLSPSLRSVKQDRANDEENRLSAASSIAMLKRPGMPSLEEITELKSMVGAAPRAWVLDFKIRGGRSHLNAKLSEMGVMEAAVDSRRHAVPKFFKRHNNGAHSRKTHREIAEARDELMQALLFLHLRE